MSFFFGCLCLVFSSTLIERIRSGPSACFRERTIESHSHVSLKLLVEFTCVITWPCCFLLGQDPALLLRLTWNSWSFCFYLSSDGIIAVCHHAEMLVFDPISLRDSNCFSFGNPCFSRNWSISCKLSKCAYSYSSVDLLMLTESAMRTPFYFR